MPTFTSRKASRKKIAELLDEIATFVAVYDHESMDFGRRSPVAMVHSDGTLSDLADYGREWHSFIVKIVWQRTDGAATEDYVDDLAVLVRQKLEDNVDVAGVWENLEFDSEERSQMGYFPLDGKQYRFEEMRVRVLSIC